MSKNDLQAAKAIVRSYQSALENSTSENLEATLAKHVTEDFLWRGMHPFYELRGPAAVATKFWQPLGRSLRHLQRREDVFMAGHNDVDGGDSIWVASMGHFAGLFDNDWLGIRPTGKLSVLRYAEFCRVEGERLTESALFVDIVSLMQQAGQYPLPPQTGATLIQSGPRTHDGIQESEHDPAESKKTMELVNRMVADLSTLNKEGVDRCPPALLAKSWHEDMIWYGPAGIGTTYTIERYQKQHQYPFRTQLRDKVFNGHVARFAEGNYAGFFGWSNLTNTPTGGFLGMTANDVRADMRVVDIYRRDGDKLAENWVFIDLLHYLSMQGLDLLERNKTLQTY